MGGLVQVIIKSIGWGYYTFRQYMGQVMYDLFGSDTLLYIPNSSPASTTCEKSVTSHATCCEHPRFHNQRRAAFVERNKSEQVCASGEAGRKLFKLTISPACSCVKENTHLQILA